MTGKVTYCDECGEPIEIPEENAEENADADDLLADDPVSAILDHYAKAHPDHPAINHPPSDRSEVLEE